MYSSAPPSLMRLMARQDDLAAAHSVPAVRPARRWWARRRPVARLGGAAAPAGPSSGC